MKRTAARLGVEQSANYVKSPGRKSAAYACADWGSKSQAAAPEADESAEGSFQPRDWGKVMKTTF